MKSIILILSFLLGTMAQAQNIAISCDNADFRAEGIIIEDSHGYLFAIEDFKFLIKNSPPVLTPIATAWYTPEGRRIKFDLPDGRDVLIDVKDFGDTDYSHAEAVITFAVMGQRSLDMTCSASSVR